MADGSRGRGRLAHLVGHVVGGERLPGQRCLGAEATAATAPAGGGAAQEPPPQVVAAGEGAQGAVRWCIDDGFVLTITLSNPQKRNPLTHAVLSELKRVLDAARGAERERVRAVVLQSEGPVFSSGHDFADFLEERGRAAHEETLSLCSAVNVALQEIPQPTIAVVQGLATAGGFQLACSCDLLVASEAAAFQLPGAKDRGFCHTPAVSVAARVANPRLAIELALLSERITAARAEQIGVANRVVPPGDLQAEARRMAEAISKVDPPDNMQQGKRTFYEQVYSTRPLAEKYAAVEPVMVDMFNAPMFQRSMKNFLARGGKGK